MGGRASQVSGRSGRIYGVLQAAQDASFQPGAFMLQMVLLLFIVLDPFGNLVAINALLQGMDATKRRKVVLRESAIALLILLTFVFAGEAIMSALGLKTYALGISGGIVLFMIAMGMVFPARRVMEEKDFGDPFIVPVAIPFIAGPSTISLILLLAQKHDQIMVAGAVVIAASISAVILAISPTIYALLGDRGTRAMERLMGMLLVMMAVQMVLDGIQAYQLDVPAVSCLSAELGGDLRR